METSYNLGQIYTLDFYSSLKEKIDFLQVLESLTLNWRRVTGALNVEGFSFILLLEGSCRVLGEEC